MAATCATDSIVTKDSLGNNLELTEYFYQYGKDAGSASWKWVNGQKRGVSKTMKQYDEAKREIFTATYTWNTSKNDWQGSVCTETTYNSAGQNTDTKLFVGVTSDGQWKGSTYNHYEFDSNGRTILSLAYSWDNTTNTWTELDKWEYEFVGSNPSATSYWQKSGNQWVGVTKNIWEYEGSNVINEEIYTGWENGVWIGSTKTTKEYNSSNQITLQLSYTWSSGWVESQKIVRAYEGANTIDDATYMKSGNQWVGVSRTTAAFDGTAKLNQTTWVWNTSTGTWTESTHNAYTYAYPNKIAVQIDQTRQGDTWRNEMKTENIYNAKKYVTQTTISRWENEAWLDSIQTRRTYNSSNQEILTVKAKWVDDEWISTDSTRWVMEYVTINGKQKKNYDEKATWTLSTGAWKGSSFYTYVYDEAGNTLQYDTYSFVSGKWVNNVRQEYAYKNLNASLKTLEQKMTWNNTQKEWTGNSKTENTYDDSNRKIITASYTWDKTRKDWTGKGKTKTEQVYEGSVNTATITYQWDATAWDWVGNTKKEYTYEGSRLMQQLTLKYNTTTHEYENQTREDYLYDSSGRKYRTNAYTWIAAEQKWCHASHTESAYDTDGGKLRTENTSQWKDCVRQSLNTKYYHYQCDSHTYTITFENWDASRITAITALQGTLPQFPSELSNPTRERDAQYTYTFDGWTPEIVAATEDATYTAKYTLVANEYTVTFYDEDGETILYQQQLPYGATPEYAGDAPTKEGNAQYSYTFDGWAPEIATVTSNASYIAKYKQITNTYTVIFKNDDGSTIESKEWSYGVTPTCEEPTKKATAQYTYTFAGWTPEITEVTKDATYTATFTPHLRSYTITFLNDDGTTIESKEWEYGATPTCDEPQKAATAQYTYTFNGWDNTIVAVTGAATYKATFTSTLNKYLITFQNEDGSTIEAKEYEYGATPVAPADPTKEATAQYTYTFNGWDNTIVAVTGEATYKATFTSTLNKYLITFQNEDGSTIEVKEYEYGATPVAPADPTKEATAQYTYTFNGWDNTIVAVTGEATYKATFTSTLNKYLITFQNEDGSVIEAKEYEYGVTPVAPADPTKEATAQYTYTFNGWDNTIVAVTGAATYKATFVETVNRYIITWVDEDGVTVLYEGEFEYGSMPEYGGADPSKDATAEYTYSFAGWTPEVVEVVGAVTYTATYTATIFTGVDNTIGDQTAVKVVENGILYIVRAGRKYTADGIAAQ